MLASVGGEIVQALSFAFGMFWEILWALILGFALSGAVQAVVSKGEMRRLLPDDSPRSLGIACGLGAASSSCSYAAVALARSLFRKGADFTAAMAFEFASTNLVIELGIIMALLLGWQFTLGEFVGGPLMIVLMALLFRVFLNGRLVDEAREQAERGVVGRMEGHAEMDMAVHEHAPLWRRLTSPRGFTATANYFVMDWAAIWVDIVGGLLIAGALAAWVHLRYQRLEPAADGAVFDEYVRGLVGSGLLPAKRRDLRRLLAACELQRIVYKLGRSGRSGRTTEHVAHRVERAELLWSEL